MQRRRWIWIGAALVVLGAAVAGVFALTRPARRPPNVLFVLWDTVRADHLSLYGHERATTPHLDRFAQRAVVYDNVFSPGMWTVPSHGSMFTGLPAATHGASFDWRWLDHHHLTFAEHFRDQGYDTFAFSSNPNLSKRGANLLQGFDTIQTSWNRRWWPMVQRVVEKKLIPEDASTEISPSYRGKKPGNAYYNGALATEKAMVEWLETRSDPDRPWLAYLNYMEAHKPRVPARKFRDQVMPSPLQPVALRTDLSFEKQLGFGYRAIEYTDEEIEAARAVYDASIRELDFFFARLTKLLRRRGQLQNTIVILTSDHGETLGEHHRFGHRHGVYQTLLHVPLVVWYPPVLEPGRVKEPVTTTDLFATLTELAGLPMPDGTLSRSLLGPAREAVFSEVLSYDTAGLSLATRIYPQLELSKQARTYRTVRQGRYKLTVDDHDHAELFDLENDPMEKRPLQDEDRRRALTAVMESWWSTIPTYQASRRSPEDKPQLKDRDREMLEALGYMTEDDE